MHSQKVIENSILNYIKKNHADYAFLMTGDWGVGKTYFWKYIMKNKVDEEMKRQNNNGETFGPTKSMYISLYGINSVEKLDKEITNLLAELLEGDEKFYRLLRKEKVNLSLMQNVGTLVTNITRITTKEFHDPIENNYHLDGVVLCLDDLERSHLESDFLLGFINKLVEQYNIKIILLANQPKLIKQWGNYQELKEKVIGKTVSFLKSPEDILNAIIQNAEKEFPENLLSTQSYENEVLEKRKELTIHDLNNHQDVLSELMFKSQKYNYRIIKQIVDDVVTFYNHIDIDLLTKLNHSSKSKLVRSILYFSFFVKANEIRIDDLQEINDRNSFLLQLHKSSMYVDEHSNEHNEIDSVSQNEQEHPLYRLNVIYHKYFSDNFNYDPPFLRIVITYLRDAKIDTKDWNQEIKELLQEQEANAKRSDSPEIKLLNFTKLTSQEFMENLEAVLTKVKNKELALVDYLPTFHLLKNVIKHKFYSKITSVEELLKIFLASLQGELAEQQLLSKKTFITAQKFNSGYSSDEEKRLIIQLEKKEEEMVKNEEKHDLKELNDELKNNHEKLIERLYIRNTGDFIDNSVISTDELLYALFYQYPPNAIPSIEKAIIERFKNHYHQPIELEWWTELKEKFDTFFADFNREDIVKFMTLKHSQEILDTYIDQLEKAMRLEGKIE